jgi:hypothetical protein
VLPPGPVHKFQTIGCQVCDMWAMCAAGAELSMFRKQSTSFEEFRFDLFVQQIQKGLALYISSVRAAKGTTAWTLDAQSY